MPQCAGRNNRSAQAEGYAYDPQTRDWTKHVVVELRNSIEATHWMNFQRDWMKGLRIVEAGA